MKEFVKFGWIFDCFFERDLEMTILKTWPINQISIYIKKDKNYTMLADGS